MAGDPHRELLDRTTAAVEGIDRTLKRQETAFERQEKAFERQADALERAIRRMDEERVEGRARHERTMRRFERSENLFIATLSDIDTSIQRNTQRLDEMGGAIRDIAAAVRDMGDSIRANTHAVLSVLDRFGPAPG